MRLLRRAGLTGLLCFGLAAGLPAEQRDRPSVEAFVTVDFFAVGADGSVFDLRPEEVSLKVDGKVRRIRSLR